MLCSKYLTGNDGIPFKNLCNIECKHYDPYIDNYEIILSVSIYMILTQHQVFTEYQFPANSVIIDPFRYLKLDNSVKYYPVGCPKSANYFL